MVPKKIIAAFCALVMVGSLAVPALAATAVSDESGLVNAITKGGDYELSADISAANAGINTAPSTGTLDGKGHTITKGNSKWGDAVLYQNCNGNWTFKNLTIDGNKSGGTFTDAALWYMAGTVKFDNVTVRNFKTSIAARYAMNCNSTANMTLSNVTFNGNENAAAAVNPADVYIDGGTLALSGDTKANVYYAGGAIDVSGLTKNCSVTITAADADKYKSLKTLVTSAAVEMTTNDGAKSVSFAGSGVGWDLSAERSKASDGKVTVYASVSNFTDSETTVNVSAAAYDGESAGDTKSADVTVGECFNRTERVGQ